MRGLGFWGSHPGLRRNLCALLTIALIVGSFTCFVNADDFEEEVPEAVAEQVEEVKSDDEAVVEEAPAEEAVVEEAPAEEAVIEAEDEQEEAVAEEAAEEDVNVQDENVAEEAAVVETDAEENAEVAEAQAAEVIDVDTPVEEVAVDAVMAEAKASYEILVWTPDTVSEYAKKYGDMIVACFESEGKSAVLSQASSLSSEDLSGVRTVIMFPWTLTYSSDKADDFVGSAGVLKSFVKNGGVLFMIGEYVAAGGFFNDSDNMLSEMASTIGFDFTITNDISSIYLYFNSSDYPELVKNLDGFTPAYFGIINTSDPDANWVIRDTNNYNYMMEKNIGKGCLFVAGDMNWINSSYNGAEKAFLNNIDDFIPRHVHNFTYEASDAELTATCPNCADYGDGITLTIVAPEKAICEDDKTETATLDGLSDFVAATGLKITEDDIVYAGTGSTTYAESSTAPTAAGTYKASLTAGGETIFVEYEIKPIEYSFKGSGYSWTKDSTDSLSISASRNWNDNTTIDHFTGATVDNTAVAAENMTVTKGSVVVELKSSFLNTLSVGSHTISLSFDDGATITTTFTVKPAPKASPQTGEYTGPAVIVAAAILLAGSVVVGRMAFKKKEEI